MFNKLWEKTKEVASLYTGTFIVVMFLNQFIFFGFCLNPVCIIAAMPHVLFITVVIGTWLNRQEAKRKKDILAKDKLDETFQKKSETRKVLKPNYDEEWGDFTNYLDKGSKAVSSTSQVKVSTTNAKNTVINLPDNAKKAREFDKIISPTKGGGEPVKQEIRSNNTTSHMLKSYTKSNATSIDNSNSQNKFAARFDTSNETRESLKKKHKEDIKAKFRKDVNDQSEPHAYFISSKSPCVNVSLIDEKHHNNDLIRAEFASNLDGQKLTLEHDINNNYDPLAILVMCNGKYIGHIYKGDNEEEIDNFCFEHGQLKNELCIVKVNKDFVLQQKIMAINIKGNWKAGWALHLHTAKSVMLGNGSFENTYTATGHALNRLKYHNETQYISQLVNELVAFIQTRNVTQDLSAIVPAPASKVRRLQPVYVVAEQVANRLGIIYDPTYIEKVKNTDQLKSIESPQKRCNLLQGAFNVDQRYRNKKVLIIDDLFRSGSTLKELTRTIYNKGSVNDVYVVTLTKTRVHR